jgi:hypothetical protein
MLPALPESDLPEWFALPSGERSRVAALLAICERLRGARGASLRARAHREAQAHRARPGSWSLQTLLRHYYAWLNAGRNWRALLHRYARCGPAAKPPREFLAFWIGLVGESSRADAVAAARARLVQAWFADEAIPGYGRLSLWWSKHRPSSPLPSGLIERPGDTPPGWSERNLRNYLPRRRAVRTLMRQGFFAAHGDFPQLLRDRAKLRPFELLTFDDVRLDLQTVFEVAPGDYQVGYVNALFALDVATGHIVNFGLKPRWQRQDETRTPITKSDTRFLLLRLLEGWGLPPWPVHLLLESAVAALTGQDRSDLAAVFGDRLVFETTGTMRRQLLKSGFLEQGGQPWMKGWIEAYFRKLHGALAHLDGATGRRYDLNPGDLEKRASYALALLEQAKAAGIDPGDLWLPFLTAAQAGLVVGEVVTRLNWRTRHALQGFRTLFEYQHPARGWLAAADFAALPPPERELCRPHPRHEAPAERLADLLSGIELVQPPPAALLPLYADRRPVTIRRGEITVRGLENDPVVFWEEKHPLLTADANEGREFVGAIPDHRDCVHLFTAELAYVGVVARKGRVHPLDRDELHRRGGAIHRDRMRTAQEAAAYLAPREQRYAAGRAHNDAVFARAAAAGAAMSAGETAVKSRRRAAATRAAAQFAADAAVLAAPSPSELRPPPDEGGPTPFDPANLL